MIESGECKMKEKFKKEMELETNDECSEKKKKNECKQRT